MLHAHGAIRPALPLHRNDIATGSRSVGTLAATVAADQAFLGGRELAGHGVPHVASPLTVIL